MIGLNIVQHLNPGRVVLAAFGAAALLAGAAPLQPARADGGSVLPFWSHPYPYGYVGTRSSCEQLRPIETAYGVHYEKVWVCGRVLHARG